MPKPLNFTGSMLCVGENSQQGMVCQNQRQSPYSYQTMSSHPGSHPETNCQGQSERTTTDSGGSIRSFPSDTRNVSLDHMGQRRYSIPPDEMRMRDFLPPGYPSMMQAHAPSHYNMAMEYAQLAIPHPHTMHHNMEDMRFPPAMMNHLRAYHPTENNMQLQSLPTTGMLHRRDSLIMAMSSPLPLPLTLPLPQPLSPHHRHPTPPPPVELMIPKEDAGVSSSLTSFSEERPSEPPARKQRAAPTSSFPIKLHRILSDALGCNCEYIDWLPHGRAFRILKAKGFEEHVLPKFFRSSRYSSFMRQINGWGFKRITEGPDLNAYYHEMFLRGLPDVCSKMRRPLKGSVLGSDFGECPDFYKISMFAPLPDPDAYDEDEDQLKPSASRRPQSRNSLSETRPTNSFISPMVRGGLSSLNAPGSPVRAQVSFPSTSSSPQRSADEPFPFTPLSLSREHSLGDFGISSGQESVSSWGNDNISTGTVFDITDSFRVGQVTPPGVHPGSSFFATPSTRESSSAGRTQEARGLSVADLCYLTQQNKFLLNQVKNHHPQNEESS